MVERFNDMSGSDQDNDIADAGSIAAEAFVDKIRTALQRDGDFPASAKIVAELRKLVSQPGTTANQITEVILREPSLGTRVLHLVNSSFYRRAKPIMTVSHAVVQIGMRPLAELCSGLVLLQKFVPAAREGGAFANCLKRTLVTSLLTSSISTELSAVKTKKTEETGYLAGTFFELGAMLTAFYFPKVYANALKRSEQKGQPISRSLQEITGLSAAELSLSVLEALSLPSPYTEVIMQADTVGVPTDPSDLYRSLFAAKSISAAISEDASKEELDRVLAMLHKTVKLDVSVLQKVVGDLPSRLSDHCGLLELTPPLLPEFMNTYSAPDNLEELAENAPPHGADEELTTGFQQFVVEIRNAVQNREPTASIITSVMEAIAFGLMFDRVVLLLCDQGKKVLSGRMALGNAAGFDPTTIKRSVGSEVSPYAVEATAFRESRPVFQGDPLFEDGWPVASIPIGFGSRCIGVVYCDRIDDDSEAELSRQHQAAIGMLAELLDKSLSHKS
jgi:HD-like signal output (HDOD) protein